MKKWTSDILTLQKFDMRLRDLEIKYRTIPQEKARMREELEAASAVTRNAKEEQQKVERAIREMQSSIALLNDKIKKTQTQSTMVKKNTEYQAMLADIEATKEKISGLETREIELYDELENAKKAVLNAEKDYSAAERAVIQCDNCSHIIYDPEAPFDYE